jgi:hypothetical protein
LAQALRGTHHVVDRFLRDQTRSRIMTRLFLATVLLAATSSIALAQSAPAPGTSKPMTTAPASQNTISNGQQKWVAPPAARSGEKGLSVGEGAADIPIEIKRRK